MIQVIYNFTIFTILPYVICDMFELKGDSFSHTLYANFLFVLKTHLVSKIVLILITLISFSPFKNPFIKRRLLNITLQLDFL